MDDLVTWLGEVLDGLEQLAKAATPGPWLAVTPSIPAPPAHLFSQPAGGDPLVFGEVDSLADAQHIIHWDPARVLAEVEAKRRIIQEMAWVLVNTTPDKAVWDYAALAIRALALPYRDRPGWKPEWAPER